MKKISNIIVYSCLFLLLPNALKGQLVKFELEKNRSERIPVQVVNNLLIVKAVVNDFLILNFIVDTGVRLPILLHPDLALFFSDANKRNLTVRGLGPNEGIKAELIANNRVQIGSVYSNNVNLIVAPEISFNMSEYLGMPVHGLIGYDLFESLVVEMDYSEEWIRFHKTEKFKLPKKFSQFPISIEGYKPYINAQMHSSSDSLDIKLLIDTGASYPLTLYKQSNQRIVVDTPNIQAYLGTGLSGDLAGQIARTKQLAFADFEFSNIITAFPDSLSVRHLEGEGGRNGSIGGEVMKRFRVIFDYQNQHVYLKKNKRYKNTFEYNKTGLLVKAKGKDLDVFEIEQVDTESAGERAGLKEGDEIIQIQQYLTKDLNLNQIYNILNVAKVGKQIRLTIKRDGRLRKVKMELKSVI